MSYLLTIDGLVQDLDVLTFGFDRGGLEWRMTLPVTDDAAAIVQAASDGRTYDQATMHGEGRTFTLANALVASCSVSGDHLNVALDGTAVST